MDNFLTRHRKGLIVTLCVVVAVVLLGLTFFQTITQPQTATINHEDVGIDEEGDWSGMPVSNALFSIDFQREGDREDDRFDTLEVTAPTGYASIAVKKLFGMGFNPSDYKINFSSENPFDRYEKK